jgi:hypothetical protein
MFYYIRSINKERSMRVVDGQAARATGNHRVAQNDEPELHPVFAGMLRAAFGPDAAATIRAAQRAAYVKALRTHDWYFEFSDDHSVYEAGREARAQLQLAQREFDPDCAIWNQHAPADYQRGSV